MGQQDIERNEPELSESSESSCSENSSLLQRDVDSKITNYSTTGILGTSGSSSDRNLGLLLRQDAASKTEPATPRGVFAIISLLLIGVFVSNADGTLVLATYGTISSQFGAFGNASWLTTSFALAGCATQAIVGKLSDIYGRKIVILTSYLLFGVGNVGTGLSQNMGQAILGRIIAGIGAAGMTVIVSILIADMVPLRDVATWRSYTNLFATLGRSIGGPLGGLLADTVGWRWSFIGQGPLVVLAIMLVAFKLPSHDTSDAPTIKGQPSKLRRVDFVGSFMLAFAIVTLLGALSLGGQSLSWSHPIVIGLAVVSIFLSVAFVVWEVKYALEPVFPPSLVVQRDVATSYAIVVLQSGAQMSMMYSVPLYFRVVQENSNTEAGSHLFPAVVGNAVGALFTGYMIKRTGHYKRLVNVSSALAAFSYFLLIIRWHGNVSWLESLEIVPGGMGTGIAMSAVFVALQSSVKRKEMAIATSGMYLGSGIGMVVGIAATSAVQLGSLRVLLVSGLKGVPGASKIIEEAVSNVGSISGMDDEIREVVVSRYIKSLEYSHALSMGASLLCLVIGLTIREHHLK